MVSIVVEARDLNLLLCTCISIFGGRPLVKAAGHIHHKCLSVLYGIGAENSK